MSLPTLDEFIATKASDLPIHGWVREPGFSSLYVRLGPRLIFPSRRCYLVLDLANIAAKRPGNGAFTKLLERLRREYPHIGLYVECVLTERFAKGLLKRFGFRSEQLDSFYSITTKTKRLRAVEKRMNKFYVSTSTS